MTATRIAWGIHRDASTDGLVATLRRVALALPPHCVFVEHTAAAVEGLWVPPSDSVPIHVAYTAAGRGRQMSRTRRPELGGRRRELPAHDVIEIDGVRVTTPARTWRDLAVRLRPVELVALGDSVLRAGTSATELSDLVARTRGQRGVVAARAALPLLDARSRSRPESHMRYELIVPGWPTFEPNTVVRDAHGGWVAEPDLHNARFRIALEYQGELHAGLDRMRRDLTRATDVTGHRWQILGVGPSEVFTHPDRLRLAVRQMLLLAGWTPGHPR
ncbi:hypothetical protein ACXR2U_08465 [Jatrophihabitans sp. YIM 134969]